MPTFAAWLVFATSAIGYLTLQERGLKGPPRGLKLGPALAMAAMVAQRWPWLSLVFFLWALGDAFLLDKQRYFLAGLGSFLVGHVALVVLCLATFHRGLSPEAAAVGLLLAAGLLRVLWSGLRSVLRAAVPVYALGLVGMMAVLTPLGPQGALGAGLFLLSDTLIGIQRFRRPLVHGDRWVMVTYYGALALIGDTLLRALPLQNGAS